VPAARLAPLRKNPASTAPGPVRRPTRRNVGLPALVEFVRRDGWDFGYLLVYAHSGAYSVYAFPAKAAIFRSACRLLPALAIILIPASVLSKKSAMRSKSTSGRSSP
jgi:hypothetical protein